MEKAPKDIKHITTLTQGERLLRQTFDDGDRKENTVQQYINHVRRLFQGFKGLQDFEDLDWIKDASAIIQHLRNVYPKKLSMQATGLNPLLVIVRKVFPDNKPLYDAYYTRYMQVRKEMEEAKPPPQVLTEREAANWKSLSQINDRRTELQRYVNRKILPKSPKDLSIRDKVILIKHLVLCLFTYQPAVRNDYSNCPIVRLKETQTAEAREIMSGSGNFLLEYAKDKFRLVLKDFKTARHHGQTEIDMSTRCNNVIAESLKVFPRRFLLSRMRSPDTPMTSNYLTKFCSTGLFEDASVG
jgi:hypothetical protein